MIGPKPNAGWSKYEIPVARDGLSVYVNDSNPLNELTMEQLKAIFTGKVKSWKEIGGPDATIIPYSRENSSGTYVFFKEHVLENADYTARAQAMPGTAAVVNAVAREKFSIGYGGAAYAKGIKVIKVKKDAPSPGVAPSDATIKNGTYPLSRPLFFYTRARPSADIKAFTDWVLSPDGQAIVASISATVHRFHDIDRRPASILAACSSLWMNSSMRAASRAIPSACFCSR